MINRIKVGLISNLFSILNFFTLLFNIFRNSNTRLYIRAILFPNPFIPN